VAEPYGIERRAPRVQADAVRVELPPGIVMNLSEMGALLELPVRPDVGSTLSFRLDYDGVIVTLHARVMRSQPVRDVQARVAWVRHDRYHVGVEFIDMSDQCRTTLQDVLQKAGQK
jgi:hypothetical protein